MFLRVPAIAGASALVIGVGARALINATASSISAVRTALKLPAPRTTVTIPTGAELDIPGISPLFTPNADFYRAFEALSIEAMEGMWSHAPDVRCVHPGWDAHCGWEAVQKSWAGIFETARQAGTYMEFNVTDVQIWAAKELAAVFCYENILSFREGERVGSEHRRRLRRERDAPGEPEFPPAATRWPGRGAAAAD